VAGSLKEVQRDAPCILGLTAGSPVNTVGDSLRHVVRSGPNKSGKKALPEMTKYKPTATGPMTMQPSQHDAICPSLPLMPAVEAEPKPSKPRSPPTRMDAVGKAQAKLQRRKSLRKQRETQRANSRQPRPSISR
jgi:hypothetical protein